MQSHRESLEWRQFVIVYQYPVEVHEEEVGWNGVSLQGFVMAHHANFMRLLQVLKHLLEVDVDPALHLESEVEFDLDHNAWHDVVDGIFEGIRRIEAVDVQEPIGIGPFGVFVEDGEHDLRLDLVQLVGLGDVDQVGGDLGHVVIHAQFVDHLRLLLQTGKGDEFVLDLPSKIPAVHHDEEEEGQHDGQPTAIDEFMQVGVEEGTLDGEEQSKH